MHDGIHNIFSSGDDKCDNYLLFTLLRTSYLSFIHVFCVDLMKEFRILLFISKTCLLGCLWTFVEKNGRLEKKIH